METPLRGKVAKILNSREIVINIGEGKGVTLGMRFDVLDPKGENIIDPDTKEIIGSVERPKVRVKVTDVKATLAIASTYKEKKKNIGGIGPELGVISRSFMPPHWVTEYETLKTDEKTWEDLEEKDSYVKTGDPVIQVIEPEENQ